MAYVILDKENEIVELKLVIKDKDDTIERKNRRNFIS